LDLVISVWDKLNIVLLLATFSLSFIASLYMLEQHWVRTLSQTVTLLLLPIITFVVTSVISRDIALSLGMVGALSIVRFRNPVRSPLELVAYFGCIGLGICATVSIFWLLFLGVLQTAVVLGLVVIRKIIWNILNIDIFTTSFVEGNQLATLEIIASKPVTDLAKSELLSGIIHTDGQVIYRLISHENARLLDIYNLMEFNEDVIKKDIKLI